MQSQLKGARRDSPNRDTWRFPDRHLVWDNLKRLTTPASIAMRLVPFLADVSPRGSGNNDRLSTLWREVISLAGVATSFSKRMVHLFRAIPRQTASLHRP
jgi:hypothetical protein